MIVHLKQSGELLDSQGQPGELWTPNGVRRSAEKIQMAYKKRQQLGVSGMMVVSGAGNIIRGQQLRQHNIAAGKEDLLGRLATAMNTIVLAEALAICQVPVAVFIADSMKLADSGLLPEYLQPYEVGLINQAYAQEKVVLVAGGTGEDNKTTDHAVLEYAKRQRQFNAEAPVLVLKGTKFDGIFEADPQLNAAATRYSHITAQVMLADPEKFGSAVDRSCLEAIVATGLTMRVYADGQHDLPTAIASNGSDDGVGTLITAG